MELAHPHGTHGSEVEIAAMIGISVLIALVGLWLAHRDWSGGDQDA